MPINPNNLRPVSVHINEAELRRAWLIQLQLCSKGLIDFTESMRTWMTNRPEVWYGLRL